MTKTIRNFSLIAILLLAIFLRLWQLNDAPPGLYPDEAMNGNSALQAMETDEYKMYYPENNGREGLYMNIQTMALRAFGNEPWALRLVSALFGILTILGLYLLTKELFDTKSKFQNPNFKQILNPERIALFASFFLATSFWHIIFSRIGFRAIMAPMFLVWSFYLLYLIINKTQKTINGYWLLVIGSGLLFGLGFHSYIAYRVAPLLLIFPFWKLFRQKQIKIIAIFLAAAFIAGLPLGLYYLNNPADFFGRTSQLSVFSSENPALNLGENIVKTVGMLFYRGDYNWRHNFSGAPELFWPVGILFVLGIIMGIKKRITGYWLLVFWLLVMSLPVVVSNEGIPHALRAIILIPPIMIFAGLGLEFIVIWVKNWHEKALEKYPDNRKQILRIHGHFKIFLMTFLLLVAAHTYVQFFLRWAPNINTYHAFSGRQVEIGNYLNTVPKETEKYVITNASGVLVAPADSERKLPMPSQTVMFITDTFMEKKQIEKNITYLLPEEIDKITCEKTCRIVTLEVGPLLREKIKNKFPGLELKIESGLEVLEK